MAPELTKTQVDRLGDRLKQGDATEADLRLLDTFRRSFAEAYEEVVRVIREDVGLEPTGRPAKSTTSITEKLRRESVRLTQMQDIAGCRIVIDNVVVQESVVQHLVQRFPQHSLIDRRARPSHGYQAVHVIVEKHQHQVEIQVRTELQHLWAELSEKWSDVVDPAIKYGGGDETVRSQLSQISVAVSMVEQIEQELDRLATRDDQAVREGSRRPGFSDEIVQVQETLRSQKLGLAGVLAQAIALLERLR